MTWITQLRQRSICLLLFITLVLSLSLVACGQHMNASGTNATNALNNNTISQQQQYRPNQPAYSSNTTANINTNLESTDQQVQSILSQLEGARNDVNSSNAATSQDNGQQP
jgi:peptidoglycan hydrolase CwlO-like protein